MEIALTIMMIFHLYLSVIMILSFMVACLEGVYKEILEVATFKLKHFLYEYSYHYQLSFKDDHYGPLIVQPAPINYLLLFTLPFLPHFKIMKKVSDIFQKINFWIENLFLLSIFIMQEIFYIPVIYVCTFMNISNCVQNKTDMI